MAHDDEKRKSFPFEERSRHAENDRSCSFKRAVKSFHVLGVIMQLRETINSISRKLGQNEWKKLDYEIFFLFSPHMTSVVGTIHVGQYIRS